MVNHIVERQQLLVGAGQNAELVVEKGHAFVEQSLDFLHALPIPKRGEEVPDRHLEIQPALCGKRRVLGDALARLLDLFLHDPFVHRHDEYVVEVELQAGVKQHAHDVRQVVQLVLGEELLTQIE